MRPSPFSSRAKWNKYRILPKTWKGIALYPGKHDVLSMLVVVWRWQQTPQITLFPSRHKHEQNILWREIWLQKKIRLLFWNKSPVMTDASFRPIKKCLIYIIDVLSFPTGRAKSALVLFSTEAMCVHVQGHTHTSRDSVHLKDHLGTVKEN